MNSTTKEAGFVRTNLLWAIGGAALLAGLIGCGGGGVSDSISTASTATSTGSTTATVTGSTSTSTTAGTSTAATATTGSTGPTTSVTTGSTATGTTATTTTGSTSTTTTGATTGSTTSTTTGSTTGSTTGGPTSYYGIQYTFADTNGLTDLNAVLPDGTSDATVDTLSSSYQGVYLVKARTSFAFGYTSTPTSPAYQIYANSSLVIDGANLLCANTFQSVGNIVLTPDGKTAFFDGEDQASPNADGSGSIFKVAADGSASGTTLTKLFEGQDVAVNAQGTKIAFTKLDTQGTPVFQVNVMDIASGTVTALTSGPDDKAFPQFSPDGTKIVFSDLSTTDSTENLFSVPVAGGAATQITNFSQDSATSSTFSPDGSQIAFTFISASDTSQNGLYKVAAAGGATSSVIMRPSIENGVNWFSNTKGFSGNMHLHGFSSRLFRARHGMRGQHQARKR